MYDCIFCYLSSLVCCCLLYKFSVSSSFCHPSFIVVFCNYISFDFSMLFAFLFGCALVFFIHPLVFLCFANFVYDCISLQFFHFGCGAVFFIHSVFHLLFVHFVMFFCNFIHFHFSVLFAFCLVAFCMIAFCCSFSFWELCCFYLFIVSSSFCHEQFYFLSFLHIVLGWGWGCSCIYLSIGKELHFVVFVVLHFSFQAYCCLFYSSGVCFVFPIK